VLVRELIFNRAPALLRRALCLFRVPRPKPRLPEKVGTPGGQAGAIGRAEARWPSGRPDGTTEDTRAHGPTPTYGRSTPTQAHREAAATC
jgi:hypothetical protein